MASEPMIDYAWSALCDTRYVVGIRASVYPSLTGKWLASVEGRISSHDTRASAMAAAEEMLRERVEIEIAHLEAQAAEAREWLGK